MGVGIIDSFAIEPFEISIVSCPADPNCAVGRELDEEIEIPVIKKEKEEKRETMNQEELKKWKLR